jgi:RNA polymerase sigma factor FliA
MSDADVNDTEELQLQDHLKRVRAIAVRMHQQLPRHVPLEDLVQAGAVGLVDALRRFDRQRRTRFDSYSNIRIRGAIVDSLRQNDWGPRELRRNQRRLEEVHSRLRCARDPEPDEMAIARGLGMSLEDLHRLVQEVHASQVCQLAPEQSPTADEKHNPLKMVIRSQVLSRIREAMHQLTEGERQVINLYYFHEMKMKDIGAVLGIGESRVSQIHATGIRKLREVSCTFS